MQTSLFKIIITTMLSHIWSFPVTIQTRIKTSLKQPYCLLWGSFSTWCTDSVQLRADSQRANWNEATALCPLNRFNVSGRLPRLVNPSHKQKNNIASSVLQRSHRHTSTPRHGGICRRLLLMRFRPSQDRFFRFRPVTLVKSSQFRSNCTHR